LSTKEITLPKIQPGVSRESALEHLRGKGLKDYEQMIEEAPPVSAALLRHMQKMFTAPDVPPGDPALEQKLVFQHGIERVLNYMKNLHDRQEKYAKEKFK
jgi:hypothetical protein